MSKPVTHLLPHELADLKDEAFWRQADYERARAKWREDHPIIPVVGSWTPTPEQAREREARLARMWRISERSSGEEA